MSPWENTSPVKRSAVDDASVLYWDIFVKESRRLPNLLIVYFANLQSSPVRRFFLSFLVPSHMDPIVADNENVTRVKDPTHWPSKERYIVGIFLGSKVDWWSLMLLEGLLETFFWRQGAIWFQYRATLIEKCQQFHTTVRSKLSWDSATKNFALWWFLCLQTSVHRHASRTTPCQLQFLIFALWVCNQGDDGIDEHGFYPFQACRTLASEADGFQNAYISWRLGFYIIYFPNLYFPKAFKILIVDYPMIWAISRYRAPAQWVYTVSLLLMLHCWCWCILPEKGLKMIWTIVSDRQW